MNTFEKVFILIIWTSMKRFRWIPRRQNPMAYKTRVIISWLKILFIIVMQYWHTNRVRGRSHAQIVLVYSHRVVVTFVIFLSSSLPAAFVVIITLIIHIIMVYYYCNTSTPLHRNGINSSPRMWQSVFRLPSGSYSDIIIWYYNIV